MKNLNKGGKFLLAHKNTKLYTFSISDWAADWYFIPRDKKDIFALIKRKDICKQTSVEVLNNSKDDSIMFFLLSVNTN